MSTKEIVFPNSNSKHHIFHVHEGISEELILKILKENTDFLRSPTRYRKSHASANLYITKLIQRFPPIRITITFLFRPNNIILVTNAFLGSINCKNSFEKNWRGNWKEYSAKNGKK